mmetsp:Transcript_7426/g.12557  ORF Transcript_7426/g.12557 Transcript_7426/m.12557 type:complete len:123 (-) Transcript_7426:2039-2407(-)
MPASGPAAPHRAVKTVELTARHLLLLASLPLACRHTTTFPLALLLCSDFGAHGFLVHSTKLLAELKQLGDRLLPLSICKVPPAVEEHNVKENLMGPREIIRLLPLKAVNAHFDGAVNPTALH